MGALRKFWKILGPGFTTGAADDDPSGIATYSQMGAQTGHSLLWLSLFTYPLMGAVQEMCARIGLATGVGLAANIKRHYSKKIIFICASVLFLANVFNIGANLGAMAESVQLIAPNINFTILVVVFGITCLFLEIFVPYKQYAKYLKYLALTLLAYLFSAIMVETEWNEVLRHTFIPSVSFSKEEIILICAAFGTTISPYLFFWQTSQEIEEQILKGEVTEAKRKRSINTENMKDMRLDVWSGMFFSNLVMFFIITACAATLFKNGIHNINTATDAALALRPFAGNFSYMLFTLGILGTGFLSIPVLAGSASYAISESLGWKFGLYRKWKEATSFYGVIIASVVLGIFFNFFGFHPIKTLIYSAVLNGLIAPVAIFFIVRIASRGDIMGVHKNKFMGNLFGWLTFGVMLIVSLAALIFLLV